MGGLVHGRLDVTDEVGQSSFWAAALGLARRAVRTKPAVLDGATPQQSLWLNTVPEPKTVKHRVHLDVDCADPQVVAHWWGQVLDLPLYGDTEHGWSLGPDGAAGLPFELVFVPISEPRAGKNRIHWDVTTPSVGTLVQVGATVLARQLRWTVLADPAGNEFCAFPTHL